LEPSKRLPKRAKRQASTVKEPPLLRVIPERSIDLSIVDLPFGHRHGSYKSNQALYPRFLSELAHATKPHGRAFLLTMAKNILRRSLERSACWAILEVNPVDVGGFAAEVFCLERTDAPAEPGPSVSLNCVCADADADAV